MTETSFCLALDMRSTFSAHRVTSTNIHLLFIALARSLLRNPSSKIISEERISSPTISFAEGYSNGNMVCLNEVE
jgi:hypothetical protein